MKADQTEDWPLSVACIYKPYAIDAYTWNTWKADVVQKWHFSQSYFDSIVYKVI